MKSLALLAAVALLPALLVAQDKKDAGAGPVVTIPFFGNEMCGYMPKKKAKQGLFVETSKGRVHVCCKDCVADAKKDGEAAYAKSYKDTKKLDNRTCPVTGRELGAKPVVVEWQGHEVKVCCKDCVEPFKKNADRYLALMTDATVKDVGNVICPVSGGAVDGGAVVVVDGELVRVKGRHEAEQVRKDAAAHLAKAKASVKDAKKDGGDGKDGKGKPGENPAKKAHGG
ncbi:MAG TPA: hypothetical protein VEI02_01015 [Planctomycetota bacterium]|nr:hypothetical protein [Planctomycetota bacterium]